MSEQPTQETSTVGELALWALASLFMTAMAVMAAGSVKFLVGWDETRWVAGSLAVGALSLTWGSWAALLWTRNRVLKTLMVAVGVIPGIAMLIAGGWALLTLPENPLLWKWGPAVVAAHGIGALALTIYVYTRGLVGRRVGVEIRSRRLAMGWTLFPMVVVAGSIGVIAAMIAFLPDVACGGDTLVESLARWTVVSQAVVLLTTGLPATAAYLCHRLTMVGAAD